MKATCKKCQATYIHNERWHDGECPMCFIEAIEEVSDWICPDDLIEFTPVEDSKWYYVYRENGQLKVMSHKTLRRKGKLPSTPMFSGKLDACINFIKRRHDRETGQDI